MMVVHEDNKSPVEVSLIRKPLLEQKSYVIVKNHVRELKNTTQNTTSITSNDKKSSQSAGNEVTMKNKRKTTKKQKTVVEVPSTSIESDVIENSSTKIDTNDLEELRSVYMKCKEVMNKIKTKYGHLLNLDSETDYRACNLKRKYYETSDEECDCIVKKKIVFDDEGREMTVDTVSEKHICVKKMKNVPSTTQKCRSIAVEYHNTEITLPDSLQELESMLHNPNLEKTYRNKIFAKIRSLKQEYSNEIRFNRHILIEKLKTNPDDVLDFKGSNLSTLSGYS